jgi:dihydrofolate reductase
MRKLIESTIFSLDGIVEAPDRWAPFDQESLQYSMNELENYDAFVMGRVTYERLRAIWEPATGNPYIEAINQMPKHVPLEPSTSLDGTQRRSATT